MRESDESNSMMDRVKNFILEEWDREVPEAVSTAAKDIAARYGNAVAGVIFYGSCLRTGEIEDKILDFYVIVDDYFAAYDKPWLARANAILPPNVFYHEMQVGDLTVRSKYAVLSLSDLLFRASESCLNVSVWARFCQPCMLLEARSAGSKDVIAEAVAQSVITMMQAIIDLKPWLRESRDLWVEAFTATYAAELRSERGGKGFEIYLLDQDRYDRLTPIALTEMGINNHNQRAPTRQPGRLENAGPKITWWARRVNGKAVSFFRLVKASMTFDGGIDYLAWKIRRHSGVEIEVTDWMRRHPILAGVTLFWKLRRKGAFS